MVQTSIYEMIVLDQVITLSVEKMFFDSTISYFLKCFSNYDKTAKVKFKQTMLQILFFYIVFILIVIHISTAAEGSMALFPNMKLSSNLAAAIVYYLGKNY